MFNNTVIVEVKKVRALNCNIEMTCNLVTSYQKDFLELYRKEGGASTLDIIVLSNTNRSWPSQNNIENTKIKKRLKYLKEKMMNDSFLSSSTSLSKQASNNELTVTNNIITLSNKSIKPGTLLIIKDAKTYLKPSKPNTVLSSSSSSKKTIVIYNDLFLIFNL